MKNKPKEKRLKLTWPKSIAWPFDYPDQTKPKDILKRHLVQEVLDIPLVGAEQVVETKGLLFRVRKDYIKMVVDTILSLLSRELLKRVNDRKINIKRGYPMSLGGVEQMNKDVAYNQALSDTKKIIKEMLK